MTCRSVRWDRAPTIPAFLQHLGIPSMNLGFGGEDESGGVYHSLYDSYHHMTTFDDPGLRYGAALSKTVGRIILRLADADTPPQRFGDFATTVSRYYGEVAKLEADRRMQDDKRDQLIAAGDFRLAGDPLKPVGAPRRQAGHATHRIGPARQCGGSAEGKRDGL